MAPPRETSKLPSQQPFLQPHPPLDPCRLLLSKGYCCPYLLVLSMPSLQYHMLPFVRDMANFKVIYRCDSGYLLLAVAFGNMKSSWPLLAARELKMRHGLRKGLQPDATLLLASASPILKRRIRLLRIRLVQMNKRSISLWGFPNTRYLLAWNHPEPITFCLVARLSLQDGETSEYVEPCLGSKPAAFEHICHSNWLFPVSSMI